MVQPQSILQILDNSGASRVKCIQILKGFHTRQGRTGDLIVSSVRKLRLKRRVRVGEVHYGVITKTAFPDHKQDGSFTVFKKNTAVLLNKKKKIMATRLLGLISAKLRTKKYSRILIMCSFSFL